MAEQDWLRPELPREQHGAGAAPPPARFELRPLSLGELLDRSFTLYRSRFWLFAGIAMVAAAVYTVAQGLSLAASNRLVQQAMSKPAGASPAAVLANLRGVTAAQSGTYAVLLVYMLVYAVTQAATAWALAELYLGKPVDVPGALRHAAPNWARWIGIALWQAASAFWITGLCLVVAIPLLALGAKGNSALAGAGLVLLLLSFFAGIPAGVVLFLRNALAIPAAAVEGLTIRQAMKRSKFLTRGTKGRIFVVLLVAVALLEVLGILQAPLHLLIAFGRSGQHMLLRGITLLLAFVGNTVVAPVATLGLTLVYFDQRVRKEALDLELMLEEAAQGTGGADLATPAPAEGYGHLG